MASGVFSQSEERSGERGFVSATAFTSVREQQACLRGRLASMICSAHLHEGIGSLGLGCRTGL